MEKQKCPELRFSQFKDEWYETTLGDVVDIVGGGTPDTNVPEFWNGDIDWYSPTEIGENVYANGSTKKITALGLKNSSAKILPAKKTVLFSSRAGIGDMAILDKPAATNQGFQSFVANNIDVYFLYSMGVKIKKFALSKASGSTFLGISRNQLAQMEFLAPSIDSNEQTQIGNFFQNLDQSIALQEKKLIQTQNLKKAMLEKMFPKVGSMQPEIRLKGFSGKWEQRELGEYCDMFNGDRGINYPNADDMVAVGIPFINAGDLQNGKVNLQYANKITRDKYNRLNGAKIQLGDIVYCLRGTLGKNAYIDNCTEGTVASSLVVIRPKNIIGSYLFQILNSDIEYRQRTLCDEGAAQPNLSARNLAGFLIPIPSLEEQKKIGNFFKQLDETIVLQRQQLQTLKNLKQAFLVKMFV